MMLRDVIPRYIFCYGNILTSLYKIVMNSESNSSDAPVSGLSLPGKSREGTAQALIGSRWARWLKEKSVSQRKDYIWDYII